VRNVIQLLSTLIITVSALQTQAATMGFDSLAGTLPDSIENKGHPYLVSGDIAIAPGQTTVIGPGVVFLFKNFTTFHVHGTLLSRGTQDKPVVFTSENDTTYNRQSVLAAAAYDWNGITVYENGNGSKLQFCHVKYSLFGINSLTKFITLESCMFVQNGKTDFVIEGKKQEPILSPYSFGVVHIDSAYMRTQGALTGAGTAQQNTGMRLAVRVTGGTLFLAGTGVAIWQVSQYRDSKTAFDKFSALARDTSGTTPGTGISGITAQWNTLRNNKNNNLIGTIIGAVLAIIGLTGFTMSFTF
jgi:hypothetical protein